MSGIAHEAIGRRVDLGFVLASPRSAVMAGDRRVGIPDERVALRAALLAVSERERRCAAFQIGSP